MIERQLYTALKDGITAINESPRILDRLFLELFELPADEVARIKEIWKARPPNVIHHYPRTNSTFPLWSIVLGNENEKETYIGDYAGQEEDEEDEDFGADVSSALWDHQYVILICTEHPDVTQYYYQIAKSIILATSWPDKDLWDLKIGGGDLAPDPRYIPEHIFARQITFGGQSEFTRIRLGVQKAFSVAGIHVDRSGSPRDVGDVKTLVTTFGVGDDEEA
jgi:hypothetical protein